MGENLLSTIENDSLQVQIKSEGGELTHIFNKKTKLEYLWQAGSAWPKQAPVLFPIVGQLKANSYQFKNKSYTLERHGFARTMVFQETEKSKDRVVFRLQDDAQTRVRFPFSFCLDIVYNLNADKLEIEYRVINTGAEKMYFSIGAHPAFKVPLTPEEIYEDYYLRFNKKEHAVKYLLNKGLISDQTEAVLEHIDILPLSKTLFYNDALVFKNLRSDRIQILNKRNNHGLTFEFSGFPYFGIWAAKDADFVCLEPWHGIADSVHHSQILEAKEGIIALPPEEIFSCSYSIITF